jgi:four helix bundle protein
MEMAVKQFEELIAWQRARELTKAIYTATKQDGFVKDYDLTKQIRRAAVSVMSNIAEGFDRESKAEFHRFLLIAKGSCAEVRCQLYIALDVGYLQPQYFERLLNLTNETSRILNGLRLSVKQKLYQTKN